MSSDRAVLAEIVAARTDQQWCLFLDRDGVINRRVEGGYVRTREQLELLPGSLSAIADLGRWAPHVALITNQQGVGKGLMSLADVDDIHERLRCEVTAAGGRLDDIAVCPHLALDSCRCRKPAAGLALDWLATHPACAPQLSVMVGDAPSDVAMGRNLAAVTGGCATIGLGPDARAADACFNSLIDLAQAVNTSKE